MALKLQAGRQMLLPTSSSHVGEDDEEEGDSKTIAAAAALTVSDDSCSDSFTSAGDSTDALSSSSSSKSSRRRVHLIPMVLSYWAMDSAFCSLLKVPSSRLGKPIVRGTWSSSYVVTMHHLSAFISMLYSRWIED
jgi:hypothetical protein